MQLLDSVNFSPLRIRLSAIVQLHTVHFPNGNISAEITRGHLEKRRNHSDIIGEHQETLPNT